MNRAMRVWQGTLRRMAGVAFVLSMWTMAACSGDMNDESPNGEETSEEVTPPLGDSRTVCWNVNKQQGDGSTCQWTNCGATSAAMMRAAMTCGGNSYSGGQMRIYYDKSVGLPYNPPSCLDYPGGEKGTEAKRLGSLIKNISSYDGGPNYSGSTTFYSSITLASIESYLSSGYVAVIAGGGNGYAAPCGFTGRHSIFVQQYDSATDSFLVYDPCCSSHCTSSYNGKSSPQWWPAKTLDKWDMPGVTIGKGANCGQVTCPSGDFCHGDRCCDPNSCSPGCPC
jgi:hypothetical protein